MVTSCIADSTVPVCGNMIGIGACGAVSNGPGSVAPSGATIALSPHAPRQADNAITSRRITNKTHHLSDDFNRIDAVSVGCVRKGLSTTPSNIRAVPAGRSVGSTGPTDFEAELQGREPFVICRVALHVRRSRLC
jgi:hypothetical protein